MQKVKLEKALVLYHPDMNQIRVWKSPNFLLSTIPSPRDRWVRYVTSHPHKENGWIKIGSY